MHFHSFYIIMFRTPSWYGANSDGLTARNGVGIHSLLTFSTYCWCYFYDNFLRSLNLRIIIMIISFGFPPSLPPPAGLRFPPPGQFNPNMLMNMQTPPNFPPGSFLPPGSFNGPNASGSNQLPPFNMGLMLQPGMMMQQRPPGMLPPPPGMQQQMQQQHMQQQQMQQQMQQMQQMQQQMQQQY